jgi:hypothetical protein
MCSLLSSFVIFFVSLDSSRQYLFNGIGDVIIGVSVCLMSIFNFFFSSLHKLQGGEGREEIKKTKKKDIFNSLWEMNNEMLKHRCH